MDPRVKRRGSNQAARGATTKQGTEGKSKRKRTETSSIDWQAFGLSDYGGSSLVDSY